MFRPVAAWRQLQASGSGGLAVWRAHAGFGRHSLSTAAEGPATNTHQICNGCQAQNMLLIKNSTHNWWQKQHIYVKYITYIFKENHTYMYNMNKFCVKKMFFGSKEALKLGATT